MDPGKFSAPASLSDLTDAQQGHEGCGRIFKFGDQVKGTDLKLVRPKPATGGGDMTLRHYRVTSWLYTPFRGAENRSVRSAAATSRRSASEATTPA